MSKKITGAEYVLSKIFSSDFDYVIPSYQRPYAWTVDQASELFDDLFDFYKSEPDEGYFLGSIVLIKKDDIPRSEVIDGQQRLTTLTILLAALTFRYNEANGKERLKSYLMEPGNDFEGLAPKPRLSVRERDRDFFLIYIQKLNFDGLLSLERAQIQNESRRNMQDNSRLILQRIDEKLGSEDKSLMQFIKFLLQRCFLVAVSTPSQQSAFRVFSVMNSRGLDLLPTDIIKADIIGLIEEEKQDDYNGRWEDLEEQTGRGGFNDLFYYIRMIHAKEKAKKALLEEFRNHVIGFGYSPEELISDVLEPYAESLLIAKNEDYTSTEDASKVNYLLYWLNKINNSDWLPPAIMFLNQKRSDSQYCLWFFKKLERLAAYLHICAKNVNQRIERYAMVLNELDLNEDHDLENPVSSIDLNDYEKVEFKDVLNSNIYLLTGIRRNYLILRLDSFLSDGAAKYDHSILTIEHVLPQTVNDGSQWAIDWSGDEEGIYGEELRSNWVHRIANLIPLTQKRNSAAQNYDFDQKKIAYFGGKSGVSSYVLTTQVLNSSEWTPEVVSQRQFNLLNIFKDQWEL